MLFQPFANYFAIACDGRSLPQKPTMKLGNTFTYRQSELPELSLETKGEIAALDIRIADFILQNRGHYHALQELSEILLNCADTCELNLNSIRLVPDSDPQPDRLTVKNC